MMTISSEESTTIQNNNDLIGKRQLRQPEGGFLYGREIMKNTWTKKDFPNKWQKAFLYHKDGKLITNELKRKAWKRMTKTHWKFV